MLTGIVTSDLEAIIILTVRGSTRREQEIEAVIDTGFDGWLSLPPAVIKTLELPWRRRGAALLADGSESIFDIFEGFVTWEKKSRRIPVDAADTAPLVGMALLQGSELKMHVWAKGKVTIRPRARPS